MTRQESALVEFVEAYQAENGITPTYQEIAAHLGLRARSNVVRLVNQLVAKGELAHDPTRKRDLRVVRSNLRHAAEMVLASIRDEDVERGTAVVSAEAIGRLDVVLAETGTERERKEAGHG